jgi:hypothetical protein
MMMIVLFIERMQILQKRLAVGDSAKVREGGRKIAKLYNDVSATCSLYRLVLRCLLHSWLPGSQILLLVQ